MKEITPDAIVRTIEAFDSDIAREQYHHFDGTAVTICCITYRDGSNIIGIDEVTSMEDFDEANGRRLARANALERLLTYSF